MGIPQSQLETWSGQGAVKQSADTYWTIRGALEDKSTPYDNRNFKVFLQGSYGNDTNIYAESDVDVVICYESAFFHDLDELPPEQRQQFEAHFSDGTYPYSKFRGHVEAAMRKAFGNSVEPAKKAIKVKAGGARRSADVIVAFEFRRYYRFNGAQDQNFATGICFFAQNGTRIANYPKQHSENLTAKHQGTKQKFKPVVRIFKNMRSRLVDMGKLASGTAPSYFIEGLLYNAPNETFEGAYSDIVLNILKWLYETPDRTEFLCANEQYYLLRDNCPECWPTADGDQFIQEAINLWNDWGK